MVPMAADSVPWGNGAMANCFWGDVYLTARVPRAADRVPWGNGAMANYFCHW